jgi:hypothetical protein
VEPNSKLFPDHFPSILHGTLSFMMRWGVLVYYGHLGKPFEFFSMPSNRRQRNNRVGQGWM